MKKNKIIFWVATILFAGFMIFSSVGSVLMDEQAVSFMTALGYPHYFIPFIGIAKLLGVAAILIPGFPRIKEWAYAGLAFDLAGAIYSLLMSFPFDPGMLMFLVPVVTGTVSYLYMHKIRNAA